MIRRVGVWGFTRRIGREIIDDKVFNLAAAVAFYWLLAIFPFLIFLLTLAPLMPEGTQTAVLEHLRNWLNASLAPSSAQAVLQNVELVLKQPRGGLLSIGLVTTIWAASAGMNATMGALDVCYDISRPRNFLHQRGMAILLTIGVVIAMLLIILLVPVGSIVTTVMSRYVPTWASSSQKLLIDVCRYSIGVFLLTLIVSTIYQFGASVRRRWTLLTPGAIFAVLGVSILSIGFRYYVEQVGQASYDRTYGTLGGVMIMLLLFYLYAMIFLIGAEINSEIDFVVLGIGDNRDEMGLDPLPRMHKDHHAEVERFNARVRRD